MRITVYCPYYETLGGVREVARRLTLGALARGHAVSLLARAHRGDVSRAAAKDPATGVDLWRARLVQAPYRGADLRVYRRFARSFPGSVLRLIRMLRSSPPDLVATHCSKLHAPYLLAMRLAVRAPIVAHLHNAAETADGPESVRLTRLVLRCARRVIAVSPAVADYARSCLPERAERVVTVQNGIDTDELVTVPAAQRPRPYVLGVGRLARQKGFDTLIDAFSLATLDLDLVLAGEGPDRHDLMRRAERGGVSSRTYFLGEVDRRTVIGLLQGAAIVAAPSRFEGHPLVHLEAMAAGAPLIASIIPGTPVELRDGETGALVPPDDPTALAAALRDLALRPEHARALGHAARKAARSFPTWNDVTERVLAVYSSAWRETAA